eukprot:7044951-Pyramimonas_sp.AAC.1
MAGSNNTVCAVTRQQLAQVAIAALVDYDWHHETWELVSRPFDRQANRTVFPFVELRTNVKTL